MLFRINLVLVQLVFFDILVNGIDTYLAFHKAKIIAKRGSLEPLKRLSIHLLRYILHLDVILQGVRNAMLRPQTGPV